MNLEELRTILQKIRLIIFDVDGVLTDGRLYYGTEGECFKAFNAKDGLGIQTESSSIRVQTLAYKAPRVFFDAVSPDANSIYFKIAKEEGKIPATYIKTEL